MPTRTRIRRRSPAPVTASLEKLGERIRKARTDAGLSQAQLGQPHFTRAYVSALELGKIRPAMKSLEFLAAKLGKPVAHFVEDEEQERKRREREVTLLRAGQLISEGLAKRAVEELRNLVNQEMPLDERLAARRSLGRALTEAGQAAEAVGLLVETVRGYEALADAEHVARARSQLGAALLASMSYDEAEANLSVALQATATGVVKDPLFRVHVLHNLGVSHYSRGNYKVALEYFERAAREGQDVSDQKWLASLYAAMGMSRRQVGDLDGAVNWLRKSETLFESLNNRTWSAEIRFQTARTLRMLGNRTKSNQVLGEALETALRASNESLVVKIEAFAALAELEDGNSDAAVNRAERVVRMADAAADPRLRFVSRFVLARALAAVDEARAEDLLRELASDRGATESAGDRAEVYAELSKLLARQGRAEEALAFSQRAYAAEIKSKRGGG